MQNILGTLTLSKLACLVVSIHQKHLTKGWARGGWEGMLPALPSPALPKKKKPNAKPPPPPPSPKKKKKNVIFRIEIWSGWVHSHLQPNLRLVREELNPTPKFGSLVRSGFKYDSFFQTSPVRLNTNPIPKIHPSFWPKPNPSIHLTRPRPFKSGRVGPSSPLVIL